MYKVAILMTTFNSAQFILEQIESILSQKDILPTIFISDDLSSDNTIEILQKNIPNKQIKILENHKPFGKPGLNFFSLVERVYDESFQYYCFADHDDIWHKEKVKSGIALLKSTNSQGYSSAFNLFYSKSQLKKYSSKNPIQKRFDYLFSSPGPGCTFILERESYITLRNELKRNKKIFLDCEYHDWAIYAFYRANKLSWIIDDRSYIDYRQHEFNDTGANKGLKAVKKRIGLFFNRTYEFQIRAIIRLVNYYDRISMDELRKLSKFKYYGVLILESRRNVRDRFIILGISLFGLVRRNKIFK